MFFHIVISMNGLDKKSCKNNKDGHLFIYPKCSKVNSFIKYNKNIIKKSLTRTIVLL